MALYDEFTTPAKVNAQIDARLNGQMGVAGGLLQLDENGLIPVEKVPVTSGYKGGAITSTVPDEELGAQFWQATQSGTYTNFGGLVVDLTQGVTYLNFDGTTWTKSTAPVELEGYAQEIQYPKTFKSEVFIQKSKNLINPEDLTAGYYNNGALNSGSVNWISTKIEVQPSTDYFLSGTNSFSSVNVRFVFLNSADGVISSILTNGTASQGFTTPANTKYVLVNLVNAIDAGVDPQSSVYLATMQLEQGTVATSFVSYYFGYDSTQLVNFDSRVASSTTVGPIAQFTTDTEYVGKNIFNKGIAIQGVITSSGVYVGTSSNWICSGFIDIKPEQDYAIQGFVTGVSANLAVAWYNSAQGFISGSSLNGTSNRTFTSPAGARYLRCTIANVVGIGMSPTDNTSVNAFMIEEGLSHSSYEPFFSTKKIDPAAVFNLTNYVAEQLGLSANLSNVYFALDLNGWSGNELLMIYVRIGGDYFVGFQFVHQIDATSTVYMNQWRIFQADLFRLVSGAMISQSKRILEVGDSEGVYRLAGSEDFTGGVHGDEQVTAIKFFADGVELASIDSDIPLTGCNTFKVLSKSTTHESPATGNIPNLAHPVETNRIKELIFGSGGYSIFNRWTWVATPARAVIIFYHGICCTHKSAAQEGYTDAEFNTVVFNGDTSNKLESTGFRDFKANNDTNGLSVVVTSELLKPSAQDATCELFIWDRVGDSKYYRMYENPAAVNGTVWESKMVVTWVKK